MAKPSFIPSLKKGATPTPKKEEAPVVETEEKEAQVAEEVAVEEAEVTAEETPKKRRKKSSDDRKTPNREMTSEDIEFVVNHIKDMTYIEIAEARGITKHQVNRVLMEVKKQLREAAGDDPEKQAVVEKHITENLSRPEGAFGGTRRGSQVKESIDSVVADILNGL